MLKTKLVLLITVMLLGSINLEAARPNKKEVRKIERLLLNHNYDKASVILKNRLLKYPQHAEYNFMMGVCYYHNESCSPMAIKYLEKALGLTRKRKLIIEIKYYLGKSYHCNKMFDKAIEMFQSLEENIAPRNDIFRKKIKKLIQSSEYARRMCLHPVNIKVVSLGDNINSEYTEHSPCVSADERFMVFTSRRRTPLAQKDLDGQYFEDIYSSIFTGKEWIKPRRIPELSTMGHDASVCLSTDGRTMLLYRANSDAKTQVAGDIFISRKVGRRWSKPEKLRGGINTPYKESHASFANNGKTIYFTSNRPGGKGGMDIYASNQDANGEWQKPVNLGDAINTEYDEIGPFFHADGKTLYFSSNGHKTIGGFDFFSSEKGAAGWSEPENLGYPINSLLDDIFYTPTIDGKRAYFASTRQGGKGKLDLYVMKLEDLNAKKMFVIRGKIGKDSYGEDYEDYRIIVRTQDGEEGVYCPDPNTGEYLYVISADQDYDIEFARKGYQTLYTKVRIPYVYYNETNHGVINFNRIKLLTYSGGYTPPDLSLNLAKLGFPPSGGKLPVVKDQKAILIIKNLGTKRRKFEKPPVQKIDDAYIRAELQKMDGNSHDSKPTVVPVAMPVIEEYYTIQVKAMRKFLPLSFFENHGFVVVHINCKDGLHRYITGKFSTAKQAGKVLRKIRKKNVPDAFIRKMKGKETGAIVPMRLWR